jgi:hypothetical protein
MGLLGRDADLLHEFACVAGVNADLCLNAAMRFTLG